MKARASPVRPAAVAGAFYPAHARQLARMVEEFVAAAQIGTVASPKAIIAPHAGYPYSGPVAGSAFAGWKDAAARIRRVVLLGPSHYVDFEGLALPDAAALATPLGEVRPDEEAIQQIHGLPQVRVLDEAHELEHCLEVELPFLQLLLRDLTVVPLLIGRVSDEDIAEVIEILWGGEETRLVISSDLSHYLDYATARQLDQNTAENIQSLNAEAIQADRACGHRPVRALLRSALRRHLRAETVDLRNSGDTAGPRDRVVGYGAFQFAPGASERAHG